MYTVCLLECASGVAVVKWTRIEKQTFQHLICWSDFSCSYQTWEYVDTKPTRIGLRLSRALLNNFCTACAHILHTKLAQGSSLIRY
jgi:hypothetical protein